MGCSMAIKHRDRLMSDIRDFLDHFEDLTRLIELRKKRGVVDEIDNAFFEGLDHLRPELRKFFYYWEERY